MSGVRVVVDATRCRGHAQCVVAAPAVFTVGADRRSRVLVDVVEEGLLAGVRDAELLCPEEALSLVGDQG